VQYIRGAAIIQLLLGNMGRPGGGILALRGHASIQGSTDIPTLFNILPGYLPMPKAGAHETLQDYLSTISSDTQKGFWTEAKAYTVSLLKAWWGEAATADNDYRFDYLPRLTGDHGTYQTVMNMIDGRSRATSCSGRTPQSAPRTDAATTRYVAPQVAGGARLQPHRVRDVLEGRPGDRDRRAAHPRTSAPRSSSSRPRRTSRRTARSRRPSGCCSGTTRRSSRRATPAASCTSSTSSARRSASGWRGRRRS
jgi:hypothetical protein